MKQNKKYITTGYTYPVTGENAGGESQTVVCQFVAGKIVKPKGATVYLAYNGNGEQIGGYFDTDKAAKDAIIRANGGAK